MSKVICISSALNSSSESSFLEEKLKTIASQLEVRNISHKKLVQAKRELEFVSEWVRYSLAHVNRATPKAQIELEAKQDEINSLLRLCDEKVLNKKIENLTEKAQKIPNNCRANVVKKLKKEIRTITHDHALSLENKRMVLLSESFMNQSPLAVNKDFKKGSVIRVDIHDQIEQQDLDEDGEIGICLYEMSGDIYHHRLDLAMKHFLDLPFSEQHNVKAHLMSKGLKLESLKSADCASWQHQLYPMIQGLLGYVSLKIHKEEFMLAPEDIDEIFLDPSVVSQYQTTVNQ